MKNYKLFDSEFKFISIVWEEEPVGSGTLVSLCHEKLGWKKSTTYTVLKKLCDRGILKNENTVVSSLVSQEQIQQYESSAVMEKAFSGSLPQFITAFLKNHTLSKDEAEEIKEMIDEFSRSVKL